MPTESLPVLHQDPLWQLRLEHIPTSVLPCYHNATLRQAHTVFPGWKIPMEGYATIRGPPIKILWPESFMLFQITDTEQKGEAGPSRAKNMKHCQLHAAGLHMSGKAVRQVYLLGLQKTVSTRKLKTYACFL